MFVNLLETAEILHMRFVSSVIIGCSLNHAVMNFRNVCVCVCVCVYGDG
jgi:hypothetical protein